MSIDYAACARLLAYRIPDVEQHLARRDTMLYALGVGLGADPLARQAASLRPRERPMKK